MTTPQGLDAGPSSAYFLSHDHPPDVSPMFFLSANIGPMTALHRQMLTIFRFPTNIGPMTAPHRQMLTIFCFPTNIGSMTTSYRQILQYASRHRPNVRCWLGKPTLKPKWRRENNEHVTETNILTLNYVTNNGDQTDVFDISELF
ncbi:Uncharacterised protein r2_g141 [Pycnogonum litorale]